MKHKALVYFLLIPMLSITITVTAQDASDSFLWLEEVDDPTALEWVRSHNETSLNIFKNDPAFEGLFQKNLENYNSNERIADPNTMGNYIYNFWQDENNERGIWRRTTLEEYKKPAPVWETVLDIDLLCKTENEKWVYKGAIPLYPDYKLFIVNLSRGGGDAVVRREFNTETKEFVKNGFNLPESKGSVSWVDENTLFVSVNFGEGTLTNSGYPRITKLWKRGTDINQAQTVFEGNITDVSVTGYTINTPERKYNLVSQGVTFFTSNNFVIENDKLIKLPIPEDAELVNIFKNQLLISLKSDWEIEGNNYTQGSLVSIDYNKFLNGDRKFSIVLQPNERSSIDGISNTKNYLLVTMLNNVKSEMYKFKFENDAWVKTKIDAPDFGNISIADTDENSDRFFYTYKGFLSPTSLYMVSEDGNKSEKIKALPEFFDGSKFEVQQFESISKDGTHIPYFLVKAKEINFDGTNPTLLYGYGGFEISMSPSYSTTLGNSWLEKGGVYVLANIRGGGEFGPKWHQAALKENRQAAFDDFISVAEDLIARRVTSPKHLGIMGGSNGGLLVGATFTQRPELFNAVVCQVPLLDMKRFNKLLAGASWMGEYGDPDIPEQWAYIQKYSPYQNVFPGKKYPEVFFMTSTRDDRVHPAHARKMVAKMESMGYKVYYYENMEGGHAAATTNQQRAFSYALIYTYLLEKLK